MWFVVTFILQKKRLSALPDLGGGMVTMVLWGFAALFVAWVVAEKLLASLPEVIHCNVCGARLRVLAVLMNLRAQPDRTYPFRRIDGVREEQPVRSLCGKCSRRAHRHRRNQPGES